jgi:hypothetical protein
MPGCDVNIDFVYKHASGVAMPRGAGAPRFRRSLPFERNHADDAPARAVILELDRPVDLREERIVFAETDVEPRAEPPPALPHEDRSTGDDVAVVAFDAEALRVAVAPVPGTALTFFMSHDRASLELLIVDGRLLITPIK